MSKLMSCEYSHGTLFLFIIMLLFTVDLLGTGIYTIKATVNLEDGSEMTCLDISGEVALTCLSSNL
jgi:hypothetical protein